MSSDGNIDSNDNDGLLKLEQTKILQVISVLFVLYVMKFYYEYFTRKNPLDGPLPLPFIGNMHNLGINLFKGVTRLTEKYGDVFEIYLMSHRILIVSGQKNAEKVLNSSQKNKFCVRPIIGSLKDYDISNGVAFNNDPSSWKYNRRVLMQALGVPMLAKELVAANQREFVKMMKYWRLNYGEKEEFVINITKWVKTYTTDTSFKISTGIPGYSLDSLNKVSLDNLQNDDGEELFSKYLMKSSLEFTELSFAFIQTFAKIQFIPSFIQNYFPIIKERKKKWVRDTFRIKEIILEIIEARRKEIENEPLDKELRADLLTNLLILNTERDKTKALDDLPPIQNKQAIGILFESIIGAIDTSSHVFNLSLNIILSNKEAKEKMLEEINRVFGDDLKRPMTYEDFEKLEYCQAAIDEVLRYQAPIPLLIRQTSEDGAEIGGYSWPAGTTLMLNNDRAHKDPKYWKDADQFKPERFLKNQPNETKKYTYAPFGGGIRICPGRHLAKITVTSLIVNLFRHYDVEYYDKNNPIKTYFAIITMVTDFKVILKPKN